MTSNTSTNNQALNITVTDNQDNTIDYSVLSASIKLAVNADTNAV